MTRTYNFAIDTAVAPAHRKEVLEFIYKYYLLSKPKDFSIINRISGSNNSKLSFYAVNPEYGWKLFVEIMSGSPLDIKIKSYNGTPEKFVSNVKEDLILAVQFFHESIRQSTLYFAWVEGEKIIPEEPPNAGKKFLTDYLEVTSFFSMYYFSV